jgi:uncharacterized protein (DUF58 family)
LFLTWRVIAYAALGGVFILIFGGTLRPFGALALYNACLAAVIVIDLLATPGRKSFHIQRTVAGRLSLGAKNPITITAASLSPFPVSLHLKDEYPLSFDADTTLMKLSLKPHAESSACYQAVPSRRGEFSLGNIHVRSLGPLGLAGRQFTVPAQCTVKVYPNVRDISSYRLSSGKNRLLQAGLKPSRLFGAGTDFESLREYQPDDEFRKINWKATARRSRLVTSQYQAERSQNVMILIEAGRMMTTQVNKASKLDHAINAALILSYAAMEKGDNVGLMVFSSDVKSYLPPRRGKKQLSRMLESLYSVEPEMTEPDYGKAARFLAAKNRKRSLVIFFTDLIDPDVSSALVLHSRALYPAHLPLCVAISDPAINEETSQIPDNVTDVYRKATAEDLLRQREQVKTILEKGGVMTLDVPPYKLTPSLITKYLSIKAKNTL